MLWLVNPFDNEKEENFETQERVKGWDRGQFLPVVGRY